MEINPFKFRDTLDIELLTTFIIPPKTLKFKPF